MEWGRVHCTAVRELGRVMSRGWVFLAPGRRRACFGLRKGRLEHRQKGGLWEVLAPDCAWGRLEVRPLRPAAASSSLHCPQCGLRISRKHPTMQTLTTVTAIPPTMVEAAASPPQLQGISEEASATGRGTELPGPSTSNGSIRSQS